MSTEEKSFNPRTREGCDVVTLIDLIDVNVSIHAPARGATSGNQVCALYVMGFNPRTREGCDGVVNAVV